MKLFGGSANPQLTQEVADALHIPVAKSELTRFDDSEIKITLQENIKDQECVVIQSTSDPADTHYMELFFFADALKRGEAKKVIGVIPYLGYSRQDKQHRPGECVSMNVVVRMIEMIGFAKVITFDLHEEASADMFSIPFENTSAMPLLAKHLQEKAPDFNEYNTVVISPDQEGIERARVFANTFFGENRGNVGSVEKQRNLNAVHQSKAVNVFANVKGKKVILIDDVITSGGTMINAANLCLDKGATEVYAVATHPDFSHNAPEKFQSSPIKKVLTTNSISSEITFDKLVQISLTPLIAESIK